MNKEDIILLLSYIYGQQIAYINKYRELNGYTALEHMAFKMCCENLGRMDSIIKDLQRIENEH